jgi:hypothetical protein
MASPIIPSATPPTALTALPLEGQTVAIVGGSSGMGLGAAQSCLIRGANVVLIARDETKLHEAAASLTIPAGRTVAVQVANLKALPSHGPSGDPHPDGVVGSRWGSGNCGLLGCPTCRTGEVGVRVA